MERTVPRLLALAAGVAFSFAWSAGSARACEPIQQLLLFVAPPPPCVCPDPNQPPPPQSQALCWGGACRSFSGDTGQFGQLKKDAPGNLEAIVFEVDNLANGKHFTLVQKIPNPGCSAIIPAQTAGITCNSLFKIRDLRPVGQNSGKLCTFGDLGITDKIIHTPKSQNFTVSDLNGKLCRGETRAGDQWWLYYQTCCTPQIFGLGGDHIVTNTKLIINQGGGNCLEDPVRNAQGTTGQTIPTDVAGPCL